METKTLGYQDNKAVSKEQIKCLSGLNIFSWCQKRWLDFPCSNTLQFLIASLMQLANALIKMASNRVQTEAYHHHSIKVRVRVLCFYPCLWRTKWRPRGSRHKLKYGKLHFNIQKNFFSLSPLWLRWTNVDSKLEWTQSWATWSYLTQLCAMGLE